MGFRDIIIESIMQDVRREAREAARTEVQRNSGQRDEWASAIKRSVLADVVDHPRVQDPFYNLRKRIENLEREVRALSRSTEQLEAAHAKWGGDAGDERRGTIKLDRAPLTITPDTQPADVESALRSGRGVVEVERITEPAATEGVTVTTGHAGAPVTDPGPTVGRWGFRASRGAWSRCVAGSSDRDASTAWLFNARWIWDTYSETGRRTGTGTAPTLSAAMLAADDALRAAGERLPEVVVLEDGAEFGSIIYPDGETCWYASGNVWGRCDVLAGTASTLPEALNILDAHGVDTAIARAQLREREVVRVTAAPISDTGDEYVGSSGGDITPTAKTDLTAERKAAAEGWGWSIGGLTERPGGPVYGIRPEYGEEHGETMAALLDAIEVREVRAAEGRGWRIVDDTKAPSRLRRWWAYHPEFWGSPSAKSLSALLTAIHEAEREPAADADAPEPLVGDDGLTIPHTFDASVWAREFFRRFPRGADEGTLLAWFANAIMAGYDWSAIREAERKAAEAPEPLPLAGVVFDSTDWNVDDHVLVLFEAPRDDERRSPTIEIALDGVRWVVAWSVLSGDGRTLASGERSQLLGARADAIEAARKLGATVKGDA